jgi:peptide/nickel transport system permease protein
VSIGPMSEVVASETLADNETLWRARGWRVWLGGLVKRPAAIVGLATLALLTGVALLAPLVAPYGRDEQVGPPFGPPSWGHPFGLDDGGIDMLSLLIWGARVSLLVGFGATAIAAVIGTAVGVVAGYRGGRTDAVLMRITDYFLIIPIVPLMIILAAIWGATLFQVTLIIGLLLWTWIARILRAEVKSIRERLYVKRVSALGASHVRIVRRHVLPQITGLIVATAVPALGAAVFFEAALAFLGLGDPTRVSWGKLIQNAFDRSAVASGAWWAIVPPGICIALLILGCTLLGQAVSDAVNPRRRVSHLRVSPRPIEMSDLSIGRPPERDSLLDVSNLHVFFELPSGDEVHAVNDVSFTLQRGELFGLVGESGCGKTTTMLALMGLLSSNARVGGRVVLDGQDLTLADEDRMRRYRWTQISMIFQGAMNALNPVRTVGSQIAEALEIHGVTSGKATSTRVDELLEMVGIGARRADHFPHEFSGGMRQRVVIAMALACKPKLVLADEPTTALDVIVQAQILDLLRSLSEELKLALIFVTHDLPVVSEVCSRAAVMYAGKVVEVGETATLYAEPRHPYTRLLFAATPDLYGTRRVRSIPGTPPRLDRSQVGCPFQPRCDQAFAPCATVVPEIIEVGGNHSAACHLNDSAFARAV